MSMCLFYRHQGLSSADWELSSEWFRFQHIRRYFLRQLRRKRQYYESAACEFFFLQFFFLSFWKIYTTPPDVRVGERN